MEFLDSFFVAPFVDIWTDPVFFLQVLLEGLMAGVMYSLVALGFALIYKASGVFNFAQGIMVVFAVLSMVDLYEKGLFGFPVGGFHIIAAIAVTMVFMVVLAFGVEGLVLRRLVNQEEITLFMATIGLSFFLEGFGEFIFGGNLRTVPLDALGIKRGVITLFDGGLRIQTLDITAGMSAALMVAALALFFRYTPVGRALRAVADDHQAALSVGIPLGNIWVVVWTVAGLVALLAGIMWGAASGVSFGLAVIALKALPVLILGGFTSIPGVIIGGLIIGLSEKVAEIYWGEALGGSIEDWFAYVAALVFLLFRPQGLFGEKIIERV